MSGIRGISRDVGGQAPTNGKKRNVREEGKERITEGKRERKRKQDRKIGRKREKGRGTNISTEKLTEKEETLEWRGRRKGS